MDDKENSPKKPCLVKREDENQPVTSSGFSPSNRYYESEIPYKSYKNKTTYIPQNPIGDSSKKESRFGTISYGTAGSGYGSNNGLAYGTMKLDIGGVALGALIGLGAILLIPKISQLFSSAHGGYARGLDTDMSSVTNILSKIDDSLAANNIDSSSCAQRIVCSFVHDAVKNQKAGETTSADEFIMSFTNNPLFAYMAGGTVLKEAVDIGRTQDMDKCIEKYDKCPLTRQNVLNVLSTLIPTN
ncbi:uncharacterized protein LOC115887988 isoform X1 [Sitophilus oryzae]|uniref:Uncharacterized protein LOC115887988 isoform X1 n=1 Tax=Sitophilus oryzae TaxID=7048 RepID=A0A6J2YKN1_SITOR|nr:uncharacterized protein LOC115887988 isoform X1 [Sitophilus oryzae]